MGDESVTVAVRVRPMNKRELALGTSCCIEMQSNQTILKQIDGHVAHKNDKVILPILFPKSLYIYLDFCI